MGSMSAQLDGGPMWLKWHTLNGIKPQEYIGALRALLNRRRGRDCPDHIWDPDKRHPDLMKKDWRNFLELRVAIDAQVSHLASGLPKKFEGIEFVDLQGRLVAPQAAAANYLRYLPPELVPSSASAFLSQQEISNCQSAYTLLAAQVREYIPGFDGWLAQMRSEQAQHLDASNALYRLHTLQARFGDFTLAYRLSRVNPPKHPRPNDGPDQPYDMRADIVKRVSELAASTRTVGPMERAIVWLWFYRTVPEAFRSPGPGNVVVFLAQFERAVSEEDALEAFSFVSQFTQPGSPSGQRQLDQEGAEKLAEDISTFVEIRTAGWPRLMTLNLLRAVVLFHHPETQALLRNRLKWAVKQTLRLTDEYYADLALLAAIDTQSKV